MTSFCAGTGHGLPIGLASAGAPRWGFEAVDRPGVRAGARFATISTS